MIYQEGSLDAVFSELINEANIWADEGSKVKGMTPDNGHRLENKDDTNIDACLEQLARAISAHVTDILIERLGLEERIANDSCSATNGKAKTDGLRRRQTSSPSLFYSPRSLQPSPVPSRRNREPRRVVDAGKPPIERPSSRCGPRGDNVPLIRYHSENRLHRIEPRRRDNETPLENRASRLRRANIGRRMAEREKSAQ
ncbi:hypothetical protein Q1695_006984 [Nippostrongylus brasiliensis]|nr:hypothetical protein Q1695_006984 [Nippostrongylus brasiliensis]